jgi:hypothetical protein
MRALMVVLALCLATAARAETYPVPDSGLGITEICEAMDLASAGDTVLVRPGVFDSVRNYATPLGVKTAIVAMKDGVTLIGVDRDDSEIDQTEAEYGILCIDVGPTTVIENMTVMASLGRGRGTEDEGDGRNLVAAIACIDGASPTIREVTIEDVSTGIMVRSEGSPSAPTIEGTIVTRGGHQGIFVYMNGPSPVVVDHSTIVENFDHGVYVYNGKNGIRNYLATVTVQYSNLFHNDRFSAEPADYAGMDDLTGTSGNVSLEPFYCDFTGQFGYDYHICFASDIVSLGEGGTFIGALGGACSECISPVEGTTWGAIKALYR